MSDRQQDKWVSQFEHALENNKIVPMTKTVSTTSDGSTTTTTTEIKFGRMETDFAFDSHGVGHLNPASRLRVTEFLEHSKNGSLTPNEKVVETQYRVAYGLFSTIGIFAAVGPYLAYRGTKKRLTAEAIKEYPDLAVKTGSIRRFVGGIRRTAVFSVVALTLVIIGHAAGLAVTNSLLDSHLICLEREQKSRS